jgi:hypothetical protein
MSKSNQSIVGEVCLYGSQRCGHGWIARTAAGQLFGDGEPISGASMTQAAWAGLEALRANGAIGVCQVFAPGGKLAAKVNNRGAFPYAGSMDWQAAPVYVISAVAIIAAAEAQESESESAKYLRESQLGHCGGFHRPA